jgi:hypothetical protein
VAHGTASSTARCSLGVQAWTSAQPSGFAPDERAQVECLLAPNVARTAGLGGAIAACFVSALLALFMIGFLPGLVEIGGLAALVVGVVAGVWVYFRSQRAERRVKAAATFRAELVGGVVEVTRYRAVDAISVAEAEDEGLSFFVRLHDGEVLFISGQYLYEFEGTAFPCTLFEVTRTPTSRTLLDFRPLGQYLAPSTERPAFSEADWERFGALDDGVLLAVPFESLRGGVRS